MVVASRSSLSDASPRPVLSLLRALVFLVLVGVLGNPWAEVGGQVRRVEQDDSLDNLAQPAGYESVPLGSLGRVDKVGRGARGMVLIAGAGFGGNIFESFMAARSDEFTMYAVTLPGFGGTLAPSVPAPDTSFGAQTWTNGALQGVRELIRDAELERPVLVGHWLVGTQVALRLALETPDAFAAVILIGGSAKFVPPPGSTTPAPATLEARVAGVDEFMGPRWFRTVTRDTWDDNNFLPGDYARHPVRALQLWRQAAEPPLHVWVRYLCEFFAQDVSQDLARLRTPTLLVVPEFDADHWSQPGQDYMRAYTQLSWDGAEDLTPLIQVATVAESRLFIMDDQPEALDATVRSFLTGLH